MKSNKQIIGKVDKLNTQSWDIALSNPKHALKTAHKAQTLAIECNYEEGILYSQLNQAWSYIYLSNVQKAMQILLSIEQRYSQSNDIIGYIKCLNAIGVSYRYIGNIEKSINYYLKSLDLSKKINDISRQMVALNNLGTLYEYSNNYKAALQYFLLTYTKCPKDLKEPYSNVLTNLGNIYIHLGEVDKAIDFLRRGLKISREIKQDINIMDTLNILGMAYQKKGNFIEAEKCHHEALSICSSLTENPRTGEIHLELGKLYIKTSNSQSAENHLHKSLKYARQSGDNILLSKCNQAFSSLYEKNGDFKKALFHHRSFYEYEKKLFTSKTEKRLNLLTIEHSIEIQKIEKEVNNLKNINTTTTTEPQVSIDQNISSQLNKLFSKHNREVDKSIQEIYHYLTENYNITLLGWLIKSPESTSILQSKFIITTKGLQEKIIIVQDIQSYPISEVFNNRKVLISTIEECSKLPLLDYISPHVSPKNTMFFIPIEIDNSVTAVMTIIRNSQKIFTDHDISILKLCGYHLNNQFSGEYTHQKMDNLMIFLNGYTNKNNKLEIIYSILQSISTKMEDLTQLLPVIKSHYVKSRNKLHKLSLLNSHLKRELDNSKDRNPIYLYTNKYLTVQKTIEQALIKSSNIINNKSKKVDDLTIDIKEVIVHIDNICRSIG